MRDEWRWLAGIDDCYINQDGEVQQDGHILEPFTKAQSGDHRWVTTTIGRHKWDYESRSWINGEEDQLVWQLMKEAWFSNWPSGCGLFFVDSNPFNCSIDNIRAWDPEKNRMVLVREEYDFYRFDKRRQGQVEILELNVVVSGPAEAAKIVKGTKSGVSLVLSQKLKTHKGFHFRWV